MSVSKLLLAGSALMGLALSLSAQQPQRQQQRPFVLKAVGHGVSIPVRDMPTTKGGGGPFTFREVPMGRFAGPPLKGLAPGQTDPAIQREKPRQQAAGVGAGANLFPGATFEGVNAVAAAFNNIIHIPPDTNGGIGKTQYVQWVNTSFAVFDKATASLISGPTPGNHLWQALGSLPCAVNNDGDPIVQYDKLADRWVLSQFVEHGPPFAECIAVSTAPDATGTFNVYEFDFPDLPDYPKMGVWPDAYYMSFNVFADASFTTFKTGRACAFDRTAMLAGSPATRICFDVSATPVLNSANPNGFGMLASDLDGTNPPSHGTPNFFVAPDRNSLNMWKFHVDFGAPANSTFGGPNGQPTVISVSPFNLACPTDPRHCVPQSGTTQLLDSLTLPMMFRLAYRNFGTHESLVVNHTVGPGIPGVPAAVRWYEIQDPNETPTVVQQSTFSPDADSRWMGSMVMNHTGDLAIGYSISSSTLHPSIHIAARSASDPANQLTTEVGLQPGTGSQLPKTCANGNACGERWGDYSDAAVDPVDDCTLWYTNEYLVSDGDFNWHTRIGSFQLGDCPATVAPPSLPFPGQVVGTKSGAQPVTLTNNSTAPLAFSSVTVSGEFSQTNACAASIPAGSMCTINVTFMPAASGNRAGTLMITDSAFSSPQALQLLGIGEDFAVSGSPGSTTVGAGQMASYTVMVGPQGGMFPNAVSLMCSGVPSLSSCSLNPPSVTPGPNSVTSTLTITTTAPVFGSIPPTGGGGTRTLWVGLLVLVMLGIAIAGRRRLAFALPAAVLAGLLMAQVGCGGGGGGSATRARLISPGTPSGTFPITVTGTSGSLQHSTNVTLTVQ